MSIQVKIAPILQEYFNVPGILGVNGNTVGECLENVIRQYPEARSWLFDQNGLLLVLVSIKNKETVVLNRNGLDRTLNSNDELQISAVIGGG